MSSPGKPKAVGWRERQIMDALYRLGRASAAEIREAIPDPPSNTAVRTLLTILQTKGQVRYERDGARYIYEPVRPKDEVAKDAIANVVRNFFGGSVERVVATLIDQEESSVSDEELARLADMIEQARRQGK